MVKLYLNNSRDHVGILLEAVNPSLILFVRFSLFRLLIEGFSLSKYPRGRLFSKGSLRLLYI